MSPIDKQPPLKRIQGPGGEQCSACYFAQDFYDSPGWPGWWCMLNPESIRCPGWCGRFRPREQEPVLRPEQCAGCRAARDLLHNLELLLFDPWLPGGLIARLREAGIWRPELETGLFQWLRGEVFELIGDLEGAPEESRPPRGERDGSSFLKSEPEVLVGPEAAATRLAQAMGGYVLVLTYRHSPHDRPGLDEAELARAVPYLEERHVQSLWHGPGQLWLLLRDQSLAEQLFDQTHGDDAWRGDPQCRTMVSAFLAYPDGSGRENT